MNFKEFIKDFAETTKTYIEKYEQYKELSGEDKKKRVDQISCGFKHCACKSNNKIYSWGCNSNGQLGTKGLKHLYTPNLNDIYKLLTQSKNPMQLFNELANNNPSLAPVLNLLNNGYSPEKVFNIMCQQRGINPQEFINNIKGNNI